MIYSQTLATDLFKDLSQKQLEEMLALHYLSALSIKKQLSNQDKFYLITDSKGKEYTKNFPYDEIITSLDDYPHQRPLKMSIYKLYSLEVFKDESFVHFDNDVILFKEIPYFEDTIVQSFEGNYVESLITNKTKYFDWIFPEYINEIKFNYNPGIFGFTKNSKVRKIYYETALKYSALNIDMVKRIQGTIKRSLYVKEMQDVCLILEEGLLWYLCNKNNVEVLKFLPDKYTHFPKVWGDYIDGKFRQINWEKSIEVSYFKWREQKYIHLMNYSGLLANNSTVSLLQQVFLELYNKYPVEVSKLLNVRLWKL